MKWIASLLYRRIAKKYATNRYVLPSKERAHEIVLAFKIRYNSKELALMVCDIIIEEIKVTDLSEDMPMHVIYWHQVKKEIRRL
jgi:hypothetical protein